MTRRNDGMMDGRIEGWKDGRMEGWMDGRMEGWMDRRMDRSKLNINTYEAEQKPLWQNRTNGESG